jgi:hypothetical protein
MVDDLSSSNLMIDLMIQKAPPIGGAFIHIWSFEITRF